MTSKKALIEIVRTYGETNSLEGTYNLFLIIKRDLDRLEKLEKTIKILNKYYEFNIFPSAMDNIAEISISTDWNHYITQQEYELLKEVLKK